MNRLEMRTPTEAEIARTVEEELAAIRQAEDDLKREQLRPRVEARLTEQLNRDYFDALLADKFRAAGWTFVRDVWPTHPAAGHYVGEPMGTISAQRPCGVRRPFRLADDGVWLSDYWVCSPIFHAGRLPEGPIVAAFLVDGEWRHAVPQPPEFNRGQGGGMSSGFEALRGLGLSLNPHPLRGRPDTPPKPVKDGVFTDGDYGNLGDLAASDSALRSSADLLWSFLVRTQNDAPWEVAAS